MKYNKLLLLLMLITIVAACNPKNILHKGETDNLKETLYYDAVKVADPFLDSLDNVKYQSAILQTKLLPPPAPPPPRYRQVEGFRLQLFAGTDSLYALSEKFRAKEMVKDTLYLLPEGGLFKLQLGDYLYRPKADSARRVMKEKGYRGAWVVKRLINIPNSSVIRDTSAIASDDDANKNDENIEKSFKIQLMALSDETEAMARLDALRERFSENVFYKKNNGLYKVYLGPYANREQAEIKLENVRQNGFPDAWIVKE